MKTLKAAIIGTGHIAKQHLACLKELRGVEIAGVCDLSPVMAESTAERFGVKNWFTDHKKMLAEVSPDVVHVTTPPGSHFPLSMDALEHGSDVFVEKPATADYGQLQTLLAKAKELNCVVIEDHNYQFNKPVQKVLGLIQSGDFGQVTHVEVMICLDILGPGSRFADLNAPNPILKLPGGAIADFLTHLSYLAYIFIGPHKSVRTTWAKRDAPSPLPSDEFRALIDAERGTALLGFSGHTQPDAFFLRVYGTKMRASMNLFEPGLAITKVRGGPRPLMPLLNGIAEARAMRNAAVGGLVRKLSGGPGAYEGLWELLRQTYEALQNGIKPPVSAIQVDQVNRLVADLTRDEFKL